jgi:hypothetical protein
VPFTCRPTKEHGMFERGGEMAIHLKKKGLKYQVTVALRAAM